MRRISELIFLTFVLSVVAFSPMSVGAAISDPSPDLTSHPVQASPRSHAESDDSTSTEDKRAAIDIAVPPPRLTPARMAKTDYFYPYRRAFTVQLDSLAGTEASRGQHLHTGLDLRYLFPSHDLRAWEVSGALLNDGTARLHGERRFNYSQDRLRPYTSLGVGIQLVGADGLATFVDLKDYQLRAAAGFEYTWQALKDTHLRLEASLAVSLRSTEIGLGLGYVWPW